MEPSSSGRNLWLTVFHFSTRKKIFHIMSKQLIRAQLVGHVLTVRNEQNKFIKDLWAGKLLGIKKMRKVKNLLLFLKIFVSKYQMILRGIFHQDINKKNKLLFFRFKIISQLGKNSEKSHLIMCQNYKFLEKDRGFRNRLFIYLDKILSKMIKRLRLGHKYQDRVVLDKMIKKLISKLK